MVSCFFAFQLDLGSSLNQLNHCIARALQKTQSIVSRENITLDFTSCYIVYCYIVFLSAIFLYALAAVSEGSISFTSTKSPL